MTAQQFRSALKRLDWTQSVAADFLGVSLRTSNGWANADKPRANAGRDEAVPASVAKLLRLMIRMGLNRGDVP